MIDGMSMAEGEGVGLADGTVTEYLEVAFNTVSKGRKWAVTTSPLADKEVATESLISI